MKRHALSADRVVDLLRFRQERTQRRLDFDHEPPPRAVLAPVTPFRQLSARDVDHRVRMLKHLGRT